MILTELPNELLTYIFLKIRYEDIYNFGIVNKKTYKILLNMLQKEKKIKIKTRKLKYFTIYFRLGFRYINIFQYNLKIINISKPHQDIINIFFTKGDFLTINIYKNTINYTKVKDKLENNICYKNINLNLIIDSPFNIKCKILPGLNSKIHKVMRD